MRLLITGKTRSGKSTALHRLIKTAHATNWARIIIADGKSVELLRYRSTSQRVFAGDEAESLSIELDLYLLRLTQRYKQLNDAGKVKADDTDPKEIIIIDEVQEFTRHPKFGASIRASIVSAMEKSGALGDVIILATQRSINAIPPSARINANVELRMLGQGFFQLRMDGQQNQSGRVGLYAPIQYLPLTPENLIDILQAEPVKYEPTRVTRYEGIPGSGRTHALKIHPNGRTSRHVYIPLKLHSHRTMLIDVINQCGAIPPPESPISELGSAAALAIKSEPTLLLFDDVDYASKKQLDSISTLIDSATDAAFTITPPKPTAKDIYEEIRSRAALIELKPVDSKTAEQIVEQKAPTISDAARNEIIRKSDGHPETIANYSERIAAHGDDERHNLKKFKPPVEWIMNLILLSLMLLGVYVIRANVPYEFVGYVALVVFFLVGYLIRTEMRDAIKNIKKGKG